MMSDRFLWFIGPVGISMVLLGGSLALDHRFQLGLPLARAISPELVAWLSLSITIVVIVAWLVGSWLAGSRRW